MAVRIARLLLAASVGTIACAEPPIPTILAGHQDIVAEGDGWTALVFGDRQPRLCMQVPADDLGALWQARFEIDGRVQEEWVEPSRRLAGHDARLDTVCFDVPIEGPRQGEVRHQVCGRLRNAVASTELDVACQAMVHRSADPVRCALMDRAERSRLEDLPTVIEAAKEAGYPMLAAGWSLQAVHFMRQAGKSEDATELADKLGSQLEAAGDVATSLRGQLAEVRAAVALETLDLRSAWMSLAEANRLLGRLADERWAGVSLRRSAVLEDVGGIGEARREAIRGLDVCAAPRTVCADVFIRNLAHQRAWLDLLDEDAEAEVLTQAAGVFEIIAASESEHPMNRANAAINLALAKLRLGREWEADLATAEGFFMDQGELADRRLYLVGWMELIRAQAALASGDAQAAATSCMNLVDGSEAPKLAALAQDCVGRALRELGDLEGAAAHFNQAIERWRFATSRHLQLDIDLGAGQRAATAYRAARLAVERGEVLSAVSLLERFDAETASEAFRRQSRARPKGQEELARSQETEREREELRSKIRQLDRPGPGRLETSRRELKQQYEERLAELEREIETSGPTAVQIEPSKGTPVRVRAVALTDEVVALYQDPGGSWKAARAALSRRELRSILERVERHMRNRDLDDAAWRNLLDPIARALVPPALETGLSVVTFALHGVLQGVPLASLPVPDSDAWLSDFITPVLRPAVVRGEQASEGGDVSGQPLVVVNPTGELRVRTPYRELVPNAAILERDAGTREAVSEGIAHASWLHIDTHGYYDPAFPELSRLDLYDGSLGLADVRGWESALWFANLSGCQTGRWPVTADSGRYGIGGVVAAGEVGWVIASRSDLLNELAEAFNTAFYRALNDDLPRAFAAALAAVRAEGVPAVEWAALMLLEGNGHRHRGSL